MTSRIQPLFDRVIVRRRESIDKIGNILIPKVAQEQQIVGTVLACGDCRVDADGREHALRVKVNDVVLFSPLCGTEYELPELGMVVILREEDLIGILHEDPAPATPKEPVQCTEPVAASS